MIATIVVSILILIYVLWIIYKKIKNIITGKFCNCGCSDCPSKKKCKK